MNYEPKYEDLIERLKKAKEDNSVNDERYCCVIDKIVPELRESTDERIRKALINVFATHKDYEMFFGVSVEDIHAWLEKQKSEEINVKALLTADRLAAAEMTGRLKERKDIVENPQKYGLQKQGEKKPAEWSVEDDNHLHSIYHYLRILKDESDNDSVKKNIEEHINWLSKLYQIFLASQPKQEWSEKDENMLEDIKEAVINTWGGNTQDIILDWLKSLRYRSRWKPTKEQIEVLQKSIKAYNEVSFPSEVRVLSYLCNELKKL